jgi:competence protein ComFC
MPFRRTGLFEPLRSLFFPAHCAGCGVAVPEGNPLCEACGKSLRRIREPRCETCSLPFDGAAAVFVCPNCRDQAFHFSCAVSAYRSTGVVRELIHRLKYGRELWLAGILAGWLAEGMDDPRFKDRDFDLLMPVPLHPLRKRDREFNQAEIFSKSLAKSYRIAHCDALERTRRTGTQTALDRRQRMQNLRDAFRLRKNTDVTDKTVLLVDDIFTTGSTLDACSRVLLQAGAKSVRALTVARA